jgi:hypothetical protein
MQELAAAVSPVRGEPVKQPLIDIVYHNGTAGQVTNDMLDVLIATGKITRFRRATGWVDIVRDQSVLRDYREDDNHQGEERRAPWPDPDEGSGRTG